MAEAKRGEVWLVDLGMAAKTRPCLVLSVAATDQDRALATLVPHTTSPRGSQFEAPVNVRFLRPGVFDAQVLATARRPSARSARRR
jgi:mRNA interferase MazF